MNYEQIFHAACQTQSAVCGKPTPFGMKSNRALFDAALSTVKQADSDRKNSVPKLVCSETGSGKTTFCTALIATWTIYAKNYSAAYVVATINEAQKVYDLISPLLPDGELSIYTSAHASIEAAQRIGERVEEHVNTNGPSQKAALRKCRVVICTHELYFSEADTESDYAIRKYDGSPRTHVFLDEFPDTLHISEISPSDVDELADQLERFPNYQTASKVIREAASAFRAQCGAKRSSFSVPDLVAPGDLSHLKAVDLTRLNDVDNLHNLENTMNGVISSANGGAFLSRAKARRSGEANGQKNLVTFHNRFQSHPGLVILDATAGYSPLVQAGKPFQRYSGGTVSYRNLDLFHINQPPEFKLASSRSASSDTIREYASWVKSTVREESIIDESVLIVVPKRVRDYLDTMNPIPGRKVKVANWGMGVGSNEYRGCSVVFLFAEFHQPRHIYLARSLAARGLAVSHDELSRANGSHCTGAVSDVSKAHRLRHFKQMASRGSIRLIDERGFANSMRLYTTMDRGLFTESYDSIFPGAAAPSYIDDHSSSQNTKGKRLFGLLASAMAGKRPITLNASDVESETAIASKDLKRVFGSKQCKPLHTRGWRFVPGCGRKTKPVLRYEPVTADVKGFGCVIL